jgi:nitroreductase
VVPFLVMKQLRDKIKGRREAEYEIDPIFLNRWSPRALERNMDKKELKALFEAARWAPSSYNNQHWRFIYATPEDGEWNTFVDLLDDFNSQWAPEAYALVVIVSKKTFDFNGEEARTHSFDTGAAWQNLALEAARRELVAHGMQGFDYEEAREELGIPEEFEVEAMVAIGSPGDESELEEDLQIEPNGRKPLDEIVSNGGFDFQ